MKKNNKGILIWVTGLSGSGKSFTAKKIKKKLNEKKIKSILINGDDLRKIFKLNKYDNQSRLAYAFSYSLLCKKITDQGINLIISTIAMFDVIRKWNKKNIKNYYEVYLKTPYRLIKIKNKKKLYLPKNPDFIIKNNLKNQDNEINLLFSKIEKIIEKN